MTTKQHGTWLNNAVAAGLLVAGALGWHCAAQAGPVEGQGTWQSTLHARDIDGNGVTDAFYDTALNVTWLSNAGLLIGKEWHQAMAYADSLVFGGYSDWRLPAKVLGQTCPQPTQYGCFSGGDLGYNVKTKVGDVVYNEMAHLYHDTLGNKSFYDTTGTIVPGGIAFTNTGGFENMAEALYWFGQTFTPDSRDVAYVFGFTNYYYGGSVQADLKTKGWTASALLVRDGDVASAVPEPATLALVAGALAALGLASRRRQNAR